MCHNNGQMFPHCSNELFSNIIFQIGVIAVLFIWKCNCFRNSNIQHHTTDIFISNLSTNKFKEFLYVLLKMLS